MGLILFGAFGGSPGMRTFDTGLQLPQRTTIRRGAIALLSGLLRANGGYLGCVVPFGAVVRSHTDIEGLGNGLDALEKATLGRTPAVAVALGERMSKPAGIGAHGHQSELELLVYFVNDNKRDAVDGRHEIDPVAAASDIADPGLDVMMEHVEELLVGQKCGVGATIKHVRPDREDELLSRPELTVWLQTYKLTLTRSIDKYRTVEQLLESIRTRVAFEDTEVKLTTPPHAPAALPSTIDVHDDDLAP
jgi:hypothetical protein